MNELFYLEGAKKQFTYYKQLGEQTFEQLTDEQLFWQYNSESNSIAVIVKHLWGNMLSRFINFGVEDGEKSWRDREAEFEGTINSHQELLAKWNEAWDCFFVAIESLTDSDLSHTVYIRNMGHTVLEALNRHLAHVTYHVGQIVYLGKMIKGSSWHSLSIPRGQSAQYNAEKFAKEKHREHFSDEFLKGKE